jgi:hypothetical protein
MERPGEQEKHCTLHTVEMLLTPDSQHCSFFIRLVSQVKGLFFSPVLLPVHFSSIDVLTLYLAIFFMKRAVY